MNDYFLLLDYILIYFINYLCCVLIYKQIHQFTLTRLSSIFIVLQLIIIPIICALLRQTFPSINGLIFVALSFISLLILKPDKYYIIIPKVFLSIAITFCIELLCLFISGTILYFFNYQNIDIFSDLCVSFLQLLITILFTKIKRLRKGINFFDNIQNFGLGLILASPAVILPSIHRGNMTEFFKTIVIIMIGVSAFGLLLWLHSAITRHYRKRLKLRAEEYSKLELAEKSREIEKLSDENASLSSIIHLDNQIIQTIETELNKLNNTEPANKLLISINQRNDYVNSVLIKSKNLASTGNAGVDAVLADLYIKAASRGIDFNLNTDCDINYLINNIITKDDFETLLCELITNSIIAVENNSEITGRISINISQPNDIYELTVMDNGSFIDNNSIPDTIEKSKASITTNHFENNDSFTKSVTIRFDGLNMSERIF